MKLQRDSANDPPPLPIEAPTRPPELDFDPLKNPPPPLPQPVYNRTRFQFHLSTLLAVVFLVAVASAAMARAMRGDKATAALMAVMAPLVLALVFSLWRVARRLYRKWKGD